MPRRHPPRSTVLLVALLVPAQALAGKGTVAVINAGAGRPEVVQRVARELQQHLGPWTRQPGVDAYLAGRSNPGALPAGQTGKDLVRLVQRVRDERDPGRDELTELGRLLGVDYLLLVRVGASSITARLYSVHLQRFAPEQFKGRVGQERRLRDHVLRQTGAGAARKQGRTRWWIWAAAAGLAALTIGLALASGDDASGDLRVRVSR